MVLFHTTGRTAVRSCLNRGQSELHPTVRCDLVGFSLGLSVIGPISGSGTILYLPKQFPIGKVWEAGMGLEDLGRGKWDVFGLEFLLSFLDARVDDSPGTE